VTFLRPLAWLLVAVGGVLSLASLVLVVAFAVPRIGVESALLLWLLFPVTYAIGPLVALAGGDAMPVTVWLASVAAFALAGVLYRAGRGAAPEPLPLSRGAESEDEMRRAGR
jgi:hypothetical protein